MTSQLSIQEKAFIAVKAVVGDNICEHDHVEATAQQVADYLDINLLQAYEGLTAALKEGLIRHHGSDNGHDTPSYVPAEPFVAVISSSSYKRARIYIPEGAPYREYEVVQMISLD